MFGIQLDLWQEAIVIGLAGGAVFLLNEISASLKRIASLLWEQNRRQWPESDGG